MRNAKLDAWVDEVAALCKPDRVQWCDGSQAEHDEMIRLMVHAGTATVLDGDRRPGSVLVRSHPADVARVEGRTFICSARPEDAGPTNNWHDPAEMRGELRELFDGAMHGRTLYVVPFSMGPLGSPIAHIGVQLTDSAYVAASMRIMTRMGERALAAFVVLECLRLGARLERALPGLYRDLEALAIPHPGPEWAHAAGRLRRPGASSADSAALAASAFSPRARS